MSTQPETDPTNTCSTPDGTFSYTPPPSNIMAELDEEIKNCEKRLNKLCELRQTLAANAMIPHFYNMVQDGIRGL